MSHNRLAVYGTLAPGESNNHVLESHITGRWSKAWVHGEVRPHTWGEYQGYPGFVVDSKLPEVPIQLFESDQLSDHWERLDHFEGEGYRRVEVDAKLDSGEMVKAFIYESMPPP